MSEGMIRFGKRLVLAWALTEATTFSRAEAIRLWIRDRPTLEKKVDSLLRQLLPEGSSTFEGKKVLETLMKTASVETTPPIEVEANDDGALLAASAEDLSRWIEDVRTRLTGVVSGTFPLGVRQALHETIDTMRKLLRQESASPIGVRGSLTGTTIRLHRLTGVATSAEPLTLWKELPDDGIFVGATRHAKVLESWLSVLWAVPVIGMTSETFREVALAARFDRSATPDVLFLLSAEGEPLLRELLKIVLRAFAPNLPMEDVKTEKRRVLRWIDASGWTFPVQISGAPDRVGLWHAREEEHLLVVVGERPDALDWYLGAKRHRRTLGEKETPPHGETIWWFSPTRMLSERTRLDPSPESQVLRRLFEGYPSSFSIKSQREGGVETLTLDLGEWETFLSALDAVVALSEKP